MSRNYRVMVTTLGRSHFVQVASSLASEGIDLTLHQGWVIESPKKSWFLKIVSKIVGRRSLIYGFEKRLDDSLIGRNIGDFVSEAMQTISYMVLKRFTDRAADISMKLGMWMHGRRGVSLLKKGKFQILHVRSGFGAGGLIDFAKRNGIKVLVDHSAGSPNFVVERIRGEKLSPKSYWWTVQVDCDKADILMCDCDWVKHTFEMYGYPSEKIRVVYMGLDGKFNGLKKWTEDMEGLGRSPGKPCRIVFTGAFAPHKGNEYFLQAVDKLIKSEFLFEFLVIGQATISNEQREMYKDALNAITFINHIPQNEMVEKMLDSQIYLFPSLSEGCAKSAYEALSMGLCVVMTKETGLPLKDGVSGVIIKSCNADSIVEQIEKLLKTPDRIKEMGLAGAEVMKKYTWERYAENVVNIYDELMTDASK